MCTFSLFPARPAPPADMNSRDRIAMRVIMIFGISLIGFIGLSVIVVGIGLFEAYTIKDCTIKEAVNPKDTGGLKETNCKNFIQDAKDILSFIMQLYTPFIGVAGSAIGSVLAFYYARESSSDNKESTKNLIESLKGKLIETKARDIMKPATEISSINKENEDEINNITAEEMTRILSHNPRLFITINHKIKYIFHESTFYKAMFELQKSKSDASVLLKDLLTTSICRRYAKAIGFVSANASVADAKAIMDRNKDINDVVVTQSGREDEQVMGWITNSMVEAYSKV